MVLKVHDYKWGICLPDSNVILPVNNFKLFSKTTNAGNVLILRNHYDYASALDIKKYLPSISRIMMELGGNKASLILFLISIIIESLDAVKILGSV